MNEKDDSFFHFPRIDDKMLDLLSKRWPSRFDFNPRQSFCNSFSQWSSRVSIISWWQKGLRCRWAKWWQWNCLKWRAMNSVSLHFSLLHKMLQQLQFNRKLKPFHSMLSRRSLNFIHFYSLRTIKLSTQLFGQKEKPTTVHCSCSWQSFCCLRRGRSTLEARQNPSNVTKRQAEKKYFVWRCD